MADFIVKLAMVQSMTGFGSAEEDPFSVEIRSLNHRFLDVSVRIPPALVQHELPLRGMVREQFSRGKIDVVVSLLHESDVRVSVNRGLAREIAQALQTIKDDLKLTGVVSLEMLAGFRELIISEEQTYDTASLYTAFRKALHVLTEMRTKEGEVIVGDMLLRSNHLEEMNSQISLLCRDMVNTRFEKLKEKLGVILGGGLPDDGRILQEAAIVAEKADICEEIVRITSHLAQVRKILSNGDTIGRKLEFILQELNREVNTIASKAEDYRVSHLAVEMKAEIEKLREQAQNLQ